MSESTDPTNPRDTVPCAEESPQRTDTQTAPCADKNALMAGKMINPLDVEQNTTIGAIIDNVFGASGFNGRRLAEAAQIWKKMIAKDATVCLTLAGAMTPIGMSGPVISLLEHGFVDFIISTGANLYHDLHRAYSYPVKQGTFAVDDRCLHDAGVVRIYDTFIEEDDTLLATDHCIVRAAQQMKEKRDYSTADFHKTLGEIVQQTAAHPERSLLARAAAADVPIYCSALGDSSIGMNLLVPWLFDHPVNLDPMLDILETTAIVWASKLNGAIEVGGGHPKNFYMQTQPTLWQILHDDQGGHDFFVQLTADAPHWGGLSGATPAEAYSWGKVNDPCRDNTVVYSCASITFPLLAAYMVAEVDKRPLKRMGLKKDKWTKTLAARSRKNEKVRADWRHTAHTSMNGEKKKKA